VVQSSTGRKKKGRSNRNKKTQNSKKKKAARKTRKTTLSVASPRPFTIRSSEIQGKGAFAIRWIHAGTRIIEYTGQRISADEADTRYDDENMNRHHTFLFAIDDDVVIDAGVGGNVARFINHSCEPNCEAVDYDGRIFVEALRDIAPGEELFYDYAYELDEKLTRALKRRYPCFCGSDNCRGTILVGKK
jgi:SET domain-containing protein